MTKIVCDSSLQEVKPISLPLKLGQSRDLLWPIKDGGSDGMPVLSLGLSRLPLLLLFRRRESKPRLACWRMRHCVTQLPAFPQPLARPLPDLKEATLAQFSAQALPG